MLLDELCLLSDGYELPGLCLNRYDARFVQDDLIVLEDDGVGRPQVYCQFVS